MTPPMSTPANTGVAGSLPMDGVGKSPTPVKSLGAFDAPAPTPITTVDSKGAPKTVVAKPETTAVALNVGTGSVSTAKKPVEIPDIQWTQPETVVKATPAAQASGAGIKSVVTFVDKGAEKATVTGVKDGDGAYVRRADGSTIDCRIDKINAPEIAHPKYSNKPAQPYGDESKKTLEDMILNKEVTLRISREATAANAKYGRATCQIEIEGKDVSAEMIQKGMAWLYRRYANDPELSKLEDTAKKNKTGLWKGTNPIDPETYSQMKYW